VRTTIHSQIASRAEALIRSGAWPHGTRLPPERVLCEQLDVSRTSLRQALAELEDRGLITRHQGRGTFVSRPRVDADASGFFSIGDALRSRGMVLSTKVVSAGVIDPGALLAVEMEVQPHDPVFRLQRLRSAEGEPIVLEVSHLPMALFPMIDRADFATRSLYHVLWEDYGRYVSTAAETLEPVVLTATESHLLGVTRGSPALLFRRTTRDRSGVVVEVGEGLLRGDRSRFLIERHVREGWTAEPDPSRPAGSVPSGSNGPDSIAASLLDPSPRP
jgi:GntR family transcriptional regulator